MTKGLKTDWDGHDSRQWEQIRAFEHGQQMGIEREQERIIKLCRQSIKEHQERGIQSVPLLVLIELIKGENK